jgi:hypothetical protein
MMRGSDIVWLGSGPYGRVGPTSSSGGRPIGDLGVQRKKKEKRKKRKKKKAMQGQ